MLRIVENAAPMELLCVGPQIYRHVAPLALPKFLASHTAEIVEDRVFSCSNNFLPLSLGRLLNRQALRVRVGHGRSSPRAIQSTF